MSSADTKKKSGLLVLQRILSGIAIIGVILGVVYACRADWDTGSTLGTWITKWMISLDGAILLS